MTASTDNRFAAPDVPFWRSQLATLREPGRLALHAQALRHAPRGAAAVMVFPGFGTDDRITMPLRTYLARLGHEVVGWGLGRNRGDVAGDIGAARRQVEDFYAASGQAVSLIGWSLGGVFAREIARDDPDKVAQVITIATPVFGGPRFTRSADAYTDTELDEISATTERRNQLPIERSIAAFFSKRDGIVDWRTCIDDFSPDISLIEVNSTHVGITVDPTVWLHTARLLATPQRRDAASR